MKKKYFVLFKIKIPRNLITFLIFVFITTILWIFNSLNSEYTTNIVVPVEYVFPNNRTNATELPNKFTVTVRGFGYNILKLELKKSFNSYIIDLNDPKFGIKKYFNSNKFSVETNQLKKSIQAVFFNDMLSVENIKPDTLFFELSNLSSKLIPVKLNTSIITKEQYIIVGDCVITPSKINVSGPQEILDTLKYIYTNFIELKDISKSLTTEVTLKQISGLNYENNKVKFSIDVKEFTEMQFISTIRTINVPDSMKLIIIPDKVTINCKIPIDYVDSIKADDFDVLVDFQKIESMGTKIKVEITTSSLFFFDFSTNPEFVEYVIEKND